VTADLATRSGTDRVRQLIREWRPTVLVNNAALLQSRHVTDTPDAMVDDIVAVGLTTPFLLMREMATVHARTGEDTWVVNIVSPYRLIGVRTHSLYCATKAALSRTGESLGVELPPDGSLTVVSVVPGAFNSQLRPVEPHDAWLVRTYRGFQTRTPAAVAVSLMARLRRGTRRPHWTLRLGWDGRAFELVTRIGAGDLSLPLLDALIGQRPPADRGDRAGAEDNQERDGDVTEVRLCEGADQREAHHQH
jgi:NAD(P)-dependent dehydrogenase (short-subunit alcohol dehydrogenase family)